MLTKIIQKYLSIFVSIFSGLIFFGFPLQLQALQLPTGEKQIILVDNQSNRFNIARIVFVHEGEKVRYNIDFNENIFQQEFLSMRPFKCIHKDGKMICHFEYLYPKQGFITTGDLVDLEYDLMFLHKIPEEYGINPWNGLYYKLLIKGDTIEGQLMEVDLNILVAPPKKGDLRPVSSGMLHKATPKYHTFPKLIIE